MSSSLADVVNRLPDADMAGGARTEGQIPEIRGFNGRDIILQIDGARRNNDTGFAGFSAPLYIDPAFVQSVEVVMGAASTLYGSGSMGGVMSIKTIEAKIYSPPAAHGEPIWTADIRARMKTPKAARRFTANGENSTLFWLMPDSPSIQFT